MSPSRSLEAAASRVKSARQSRWLRRAARIAFPLLLISALYFAVSLHSRHSLQEQGEKEASSRSREPIPTGFDPASKQDQSGQACESKLFGCPPLPVTIFARQSLSMPLTPRGVSDNSSSAAGGHQKAAEMSTFVISTSEGDITVKFRADAAPKHAAFMTSLIREPPPPRIHVSHTSSSFPSSPRCGSRGRTPIS